MTTGTEIVERALEVIGAHTIVSPAAPESINLGFEQLNSMLELWLSQNIKIGFTPLEVVGGELNEPTDTRNGIINNLGIELAPFFDNGKVVVSPALARNAKASFKMIRNLYQSVTIPEKVVSSTLPVGAGNRTGVRDRVFFPKGQTIEN